MPGVSCLHFLPFVRRCKEQVRSGDGTRLILVPGRLITILVRQGPYVLEAGVDSFSLLSSPFSFSLELLTYTITD